MTMPRYDLATLTAKLTEVRKRAITDFWSSTDSVALNHWWVCRMCDWKWRDGEAELHEPSCPIREAP